ncbi:class I SAM-dependent methyltransferase [Sulfurimonas marina]|uniref:Class I SAM-dependent methyltransferase n=1 Tax=Sulfurimonas marina TaxID=2590551 RepID=A0A7M1AVN1_9BACT|nr:class I SAM-dependent methyltransferase [Sulfurimonas marina]QOP41521.1 class I SAM-dependent methyltransferase [Sulfurimonas marina]
MNQTCRLCGTQAQFFHQDKQKYFRCPTCKAIFTEQEDLPNESSEKERYELHDTEIDEGYKKFVSPITSHVIKEFSKEDKGLDFGSGRSRVISKVLEEHGFSIESYDPFFSNKPQLLEQKYHYITSCEVIEHFYEPGKEFERIKSMLQEGGKLYLMTELYNDSIDFASWYYKNDPTHVFFYTKETFEWIKQHYKFSKLIIEKRLIVFSN